MTQTPLFPQPGNRFDRLPVRRTDPETSHAAAREAVERESRKGGHDERCLEALKRLGRATYREVAREAGLEPIQAQRALTRLSYRRQYRDTEHARQTTERRACRTNGRTMQLWEAV